MARWISVGCVLVLCLVTSLVQAAPELDIIVPAAAHGAGAGGSNWVTSLYLRNTAQATANVLLYWLERNVANPQPISAAYTVEPGETLVLDDAVQESFQLSAGAGAIGITADQPVSASAAILNTAGGSEFGQGFAAVPVSAALGAGERTSVVGIKHDSTYRTNVYLIDATGSGSEATVNLIDTDGTTVASRQYTLAAYEPRLDSLDTFGKTTLANGVVEIVVTSGAVIGGASRVNQATGDPVTLAPPLPEDGSGDDQACDMDGTYELSAYDSWDWTSTGGSLVITDGAVTAFDLTYVNLDDPECGSAFHAGGTFITPVELATFEQGVEFTEQYDSGGEITYQIRFTHDGSTALSGTLDATGSNFTGGEAGCNGSFPSLTLRGGKS